MNELIRKAGIRIHRKSGHSYFTVRLEDVKRLKKILKFPDFIETEYDNIAYLESLVKDIFHRKASARLVESRGVDYKKYERTPDRLRVEDSGKFCIIEGEVVRVDSIKPACISVKFKCSDCDNMVHIIQQSVKFRWPRRCGCGRKGSFRWLSRVMIYSRIIGLRLNKNDVFPVLLEQELVYKKIKQGDVIRVIGLVEFVRYVYNRGASPFGRFQINANNITTITMARNVKG